MRWGRAFVGISTDSRMNWGCCGIFGWEWRLLGTWRLRGLWCRGHGIVGLRSPFERYPWERDWSGRIKFVQLCLAPCWEGIGIDPSGALARRAKEMSVSRWCPSNAVSYAMRAFSLDPGVSFVPSWSRPELRFRNMVRKVVFRV
jgi:hypothetical protein